jgi:hypothetical protein
MSGCWQPMKAFKVSTLGIRAYHSALGFHALVGMILDDSRLSVRASSGP